MISPLEQIQEDDSSSPYTALETKDESPSNSPESSQGTALKTKDESPSNLPESSEDTALKTKDESPSNFPESSHNMVGKYATLMETNEKECESWYSFIKKDGNEEPLEHLQKQLEQVDWEIMEDMSTFDLDLDYFVNAQTAKEMTKLDLNACLYHRKFDGKMKLVNLGLKRKDKNETKMCKAFEQLGYGQIEDYISDEDIDTEDLTDGSDEEDEESSSEEEDKRVTKLPPTLSNNKNIPKFSKKQR